jgi:hypothetical protein
VSDELVETTLREKVERGVKGCSVLWGEDCSALLAALDTQEALDWCANNGVMAIDRKDGGWEVYSQRGTPMWRTGWGKTLSEAVSELRAQEEAK